jgi:AraC family transcriptional regulator
MSEGAKHLGGGNFYGAIRARQEFDGVIFTDLQHRCARKLPKHAHELSFFALILDGSYRERYGRQQNQFGPFTLSFRPAGIPHQDEVGPQGVRFFDMEIRPEWRLRMKDAGGSLDFPMDEVGGGELLWIAMKIFRETRGAISGRDIYLDSLLAELMAGVACIPAERANDAPSWLRRTLDRIHEQYRQKLTLNELSLEAGVHPVHLSRIFRRCQKIGIGDYIRRLRVRSACEKMLDPEASLADISFDTGFADQSHFTRTFAGLTGMSPNRFRQLLAKA